MPTVPLLLMQVEHLPPPQPATEDAHGAAYYHQIGKKGGRRTKALLARGRMLEEGHKTE